MDEYRIQKLTISGWENVANISGHVELIQWATKEAGVVSNKPRKGDTYFDYLQEKWIEAKKDWSEGYRPVIPSPEPEPERGWVVRDDRLCENCQGVKPGSGVASKMLKGGFWVCIKCGREKSEWTYAPPPDLGGIGSGGTGGPI